MTNRFERGPIPNVPTPHGGTVSVPAVPTGPFFLELQLDAGTLAELVANRIRIEPLCIAQKLPAPITGAPTLVLDHVEVPEGTRFVWSQDGPPEIHLVVPLTVYLFDFESETTLPISFDVTLGLEANGAQICVTLVGTDLPQEFAAYTDSFTSMLDVAHLCSTIDLTQLQRLVGDSAVGAAALTSNGGLTLIALRLLVGDETSGPSWTAFRDAPVQTLLASGEEFVLLLTADLLTATALQQAVDGFTSQTDIAITGGPDATWSPDPITLVMKDFPSEPPGQTKRFQGSVSVTLDAESWKTGCQIGFSASAITCLEVTEPNVLSVTTRIDWSANFWDAFFCFGIGPIGDLVALFYVPDLPAPSLCDRTTDHIIECSYPVALPPLDFGSGSTLATFTLTSYRPDPLGALLGGTLTLAPVITPTLSLRNSRLAWAVQGSCDHFFVGAEASAIVESIPPLSSTYCHFEVLDDPLDLFGPRMSVEPGSGNGLPQTVTFTFELDDVPPGHPYWSDPYPLRLLVQTTAGAGVADLGTLQAQPDGSDLAGLQERSALVQAECSNRSAGLFGIPGKFDVHWLVDPAPEGISVWEGAITNASPGDAFQLVDDRGAIVGSSIAQEDGGARLTAHLQGAATAPIQIVRAEGQAEAVGAAAAAGAAAGAAEIARLHQRQIRLAQRAVVELAAPCVSLRTEVVDGVIALTAVTTDGIEFHDVSAPQRPRVFVRVPGRGLRGAMPWGRGILFWGPEGATGPERGDRVHEAVEAAERFGDRLIALTRDGLRVFGPELQLLGHVQLRHTGHMARAGRVVAVGSPSGLVVVDVSDPTRPVISGTLDLPPVHGVLAGRYVGGTSTVVAVHEGGVTVVDAGGTPRAVARYASVPWMAVAHPARGAWCRIEADRTRVGIYAVVAMAEGWRPTL